MDEYYAAIRRLPGFLRRPLEDLSPRQAQTIHEIHLRSGRPVVLTCADGQFCLPGQGAGQGGPVLTHAQLQECFYSLCEHSVHSYEQQLARGFFTLPGGHRVGVAGLFHMQGQAMKGLCTVTSLNIRIARTVTGQRQDHFAARRVGTAEPRGQKGGGGGRAGGDMALRSGRICRAGADALRCAQRL